jgi:hypothetical protein
MIGDLLKSASRVALVAVASVTVSGVAAQAADLGGNCCADLEERVAELEATAARKGNRKVSLTVYGQVNEAVLFWNDGQERNAYVVSNNGGATRFGFRGDAKITSDVSAGYLLEISARYANSGSRSQAASGAGGNANQFEIRHSAWYLDSKSLGRVWVGRTAGASEGITEINLSNVQNVGPAFDPWTGGMFARGNGVAPGPNFAAGSLTWANLAHQGMGSAMVGEGDRSNVVKYVSPTIFGFIATTSWGEDDKLDAALRYAGEFSGFRLAAGIGYQKLTDFNTNNNNNGCRNNSTGAGLGAAGTANNSAVDCSAIGLSASVMHVPTGIYVAGAYGKQKDNKINETAAVALAAGVTQGMLSDTNKQYYLQAGIEQKWFSLGKSTVYGEYGKQTTGTQFNTTTNTLRAVTTDLSTVAGSLIGSEIKYYGIGFNQAIDAAAADLYVSFRNFSATGTSVSAAGVQSNFSPKDFQAVMTGMIIRF